MSEQRGKSWRVNTYENIGNHGLTHNFTLFSKANSQKNANIITSLNILN